LEPTFIERIIHRVPFYREKPPAKQTISDQDGMSNADLTEFIKDLKTS
jgi:hypothetical protein